MFNALALIEHTNVFNAMKRAILGQQAHLPGTSVIDDAHGVDCSNRSGGVDVIHHG